MATNKDIQFVEKDIKGKNPYVSAMDKFMENKKIENSAQNYFDSIARTNEPFAFQSYDVPITDAYTKLNSGDYIRKFDNFIKGTNNEDRLAREQGTLEKWGHGMAKLAGKTGTSILGGTIGVVNGIINGVKEGSLQATYSNDFNEWLDDLNTKMDYKLPNYYTEQEKNLGFFDSLGKANFWANDVTEGLSFTLGMLVSEGIWAYATGGTSLIAKGALGWSTRNLSKAKSLTALSKAKEVGKEIIRKGEQQTVEQLQKAAVRGVKMSRMANNARFLITSAGYESGVEARHYMKSTEEEWLYSFKELNGRAPTSEERSVFMDQLNSTANRVFGANLGLVGASNLVMFGKILNGTPINQSIRNNWFKNKVLGIGYKTVDGKKIALQATRPQKFARAGYTFGKYGLLEGVVEEGGQGVISGAGESFMLNTFDPSSTKDSIGLMESIIDGFEQSYGTKEGQKAVGIGFLIGIFGGAVATRGRFNEASQQQKAIEQEVEFSNAVTSDILFNRLKEANRIQKATEKDDGTYVGSAMSKREAMYSRIIRDIRIGGLESGYKDLQAYLEKTNDAEVAESLGVDISNKEAIESYKASVLEDYKSLSSTVLDNINYAEAVIGDSQIAGLNDVNSKELAEAVAYTLTMGKASDEISDSLANNIKEIVADRLGVETSNAISVENALRKVGEDKKQAYKKAARKVELKKEQVNILQTQIVDLQSLNETASSENAEANKARAARLNKLNKKLLKLSEELTKLESQKQLAFDTANIARFSDDIVTMDMLDNQKEAMKKLKSSLNGLSIQDQKLIGTLIKEYERAVTATDQYNKTINTLSSENTRVNLLNGWLSNLINKNKKLNEGVDAYFREILDRYDTSRKSTAVFTETQEQAEGNIVQRRETPTEETTPSNTIEALKAKIKQIVEENPYISEYVGEDILNNRTIDKKDVDRYQELLGKIKNPQDVLRQEPTDEDSEEVKEFRNLNQKLNNWKTLDGSGVGSYLLLLKNLQDYVQREGTSTKNSPQSLIYATEGNQNQGSGTTLTNVNTVLSPANKLARLDQEGNYVLSHVNIDSLAEIIPNSEITVNGRPIEKARATTKKAIGTVFEIKTPGLTTKAEILEHNRISIKKEDFEKMLEGSTVRILDTGVSNYMPLYENGQPIEGDFDFIAEDGSLISFNENATYDINADDVLVTEISLKDAFNSKLLSQYQAGKITKDQLADGLVIYVKPQADSNTIVGMLRKLSEQNRPSRSVDALREIRSRAVDIVLRSKTDTVDLEINIPVNKVLLGNPNFTTKEEGNFLVPETINFNGESVSRVLATGYAINGVTQLNKNISYNNTIVKRIGEREVNRNKKVPVIVFRYRETNVAFPVDLIEGESIAVEQAQQILDLEIDPIEKGVKFSNLMLEKGLNPSSYNIDFSTEGWENTTAVEDVLTRLSEVKEFANLETWLDPNFNPSNLIQQAKIAVDINNKPLMSGKIIIELENRTPYNQKLAKQRFRNKLEQDRISLVEELSEEIILLERLFQDSSDLSNRDADSEFLLEMYETDVVKDPSAYIDHAKNVAILTRMFEYKIPRAVAKRIGKEKIDSIRKRLIYLEQLKEREKAIPVTVPSLTHQQRAEISLALAGTSYNSIEEVLPKMMKGFYSRGEFNPSIESLTQSGIYSESEAVILMEDSDKLKQIEKLLLQLQLNEEDIEANYYGDDRFNSVGKGLDILGKLKQDNPYINEKEAIDRFGGIKDREQFEIELEQSELGYLQEVYENTKGTEDDLFLLFSSYDRAQVKEIVGEELVDKTDSSKELLEETLTEPSTKKLEKNIDFLLSLDPVVVQTSEEDLQKVIDETLDNTIDIGLDLSNLKGKSLEELRPIFEAIADFAQFQDKESFDNLVKEYDAINDVGNDAVTKAVKVNSEVTGRTGIVYLETELPGHILFEKYNLLPLGNNTYLTITPQSLEVMYEELFNSKEIIPVYFNVSTREDLKNYIGSEIKKIDTQGEAYNVETLERMYIASLFFGANITSAEVGPNISEQATLFTNPVKNAEYLQTTFVADFNKKMIQAKRDGKEIYNNFYSKFHITKNGIELISADPITFMEIEPYLTDNIRTYLQITNQLPIEPYNDVLTMDIKRLYFLYNPKTLPTFTKEYQRVNSQTVFSRESEDFIKINGEIYESVDSVGDYNFYSLLDVQIPAIKDYKANIEKPVLNVDLSKYQYLVEGNSSPTIKNVYTKDVEEEIDDELECN